MSKDLRSKVIRLAHSNPELRKDLLPLLRQASHSDKNKVLRTLQQAVNAVATAELQLDIISQQVSDEDYDSYFRGGLLDSRITMGVSSLKADISRLIQEIEKTKSPTGKKAMLYQNPYDHALSEIRDMLSYQFDDLVGLMNSKEKKNGMVLSLFWHEKRENFNRQDWENAANQLPRELREAIVGRLGNLDAYFPNVGKVSARVLWDRGLYLEATVSWK